MGEATQLLRSAHVLMMVMVINCALLSNVLNISVIKKLLSGLLNI
jgi:hypothetical protein